MDVDEVHYKKELLLRTWCIEEATKCNMPQVIHALTVPCALNREDPPELGHVLRHWVFSKGNMEAATRAIKKFKEELETQKQEHGERPEGGMTRHTWELNMGYYRRMEGHCGTLNVILNQMLWNLDMN